MTRTAPKRGRSLVAVVAFCAMGSAMSCRLGYEGLSSASRNGPSAGTGAEQGDGGAGNAASGKGGAIHAGTAASGDGGAGSPGGDSSAGGGGDSSAGGTGGTGSTGSTGGTGGTGGGVCAPGTTRCVDHRLDTCSAERLWDEGALCPLPNPWCSSGACGPVPKLTLLTAYTPGATGWPKYLAADEQSVYWTTTNPGAVQKVPSLGGSPIQLTAALTFSSGFAARSGSLFWATWNVEGQSEVASVPGGGGQKLTLSTGPGQPSGIAVDDEHVYWIPNTSEIKRTPLAGGAATTFVAGQRRTTAVAVDATFVYWVDWVGPADGTYRLLRAPKSGGASIAFPSTYTYPNALVAGTDGVYMLEGGDPTSATGRVLKFPSGGGSPVVLASGQRHPLALALDENYAYFTCSPWAGYGMPKTAVMVPRSGGTPITLATLEAVAVTHAAQYVALNKAGIYFNDANLNQAANEYSIWRLPR